MNMLPSCISNIRNVNETSKRPGGGAAQVSGKALEHVNRRGSIREAASPQGRRISA
jgi:hypothetical protein